MAITTRIHGDTAHLIISGLFDATVYQAFKHACALLINNHAVKNIDVDLSGTEYRTARRWACWCSSTRTPDRRRNPCR